MKVVATDLAALLEKQGRTYHQLGGEAISSIDEPASFFPSVANGQKSSTPSHGDIKPKIGITGSASASGSSSKKTPFSSGDNVITTTDGRKIIVSKQKHWIELDHHHAEIEPDSKRARLRAEMKSEYPATR